MTKVKTFEFKVSFARGRAYVYNTDTYADKHREYLKAHSKTSDPDHIWTPAEIDKAVNAFIEDKDVIDIKVSNYVYDRHNNGGCDSVVEVYTILYKIG